MAKKSSIMKKLNPILKDANDLKNKRNYADAVTKYREAISFIRLKGKDMEDRELEVKNVIVLIDQTFSAEIGNHIIQAKQLIDEKNFEGAENQLKNAMNTIDKIEDSDLKAADKEKIDYEMNQTNLRKLINQGEIIKEEGKFEEAIKILRNALSKANKIYNSSQDNVEILSIKNLINQTFSDKIKIIMDEGQQLKQNNKPEDAIKIFEVAIETAEKMFDSELKTTEISNIEGEINQIYSDQIYPIIDEGKQLLEQGNKDRAIPVLKKALIIQNKMYISELTTNILNKIGVLLNPIFSEMIKSIKEKGLPLIKQENYEESISIVTDAVKIFGEALDLANQMADTEDKVEVLEDIQSLIDNTCSAGIKVREERGIRLIAQKNFEEAVGEMYSALSIAKNMSCAEEDNREIEKIKGLINQVYIAQANDVVEKGKVHLNQKQYDEAREIFNEAMSITNKMYLSEEMDKEISSIKNLLYQAEMKHVVAEGYVTEEQQKFEEEIGKLKEELEKANSITDAERRNKRIGEVKHLIDSTYSDQIHLLIEQANQLAEQDKFDNAIEMVDKGLKFIDVIENNIIKNNDLTEIIDTTINYATLLAEKNQFEESFRDFEKALEIAEKITDKNKTTEEVIKIKGFFTKELNNKAHIDIENGKNDSAMDYCNKAIELDKEFPISYYNLGNAHVNKKEYDTAIDYYTKAVELDSKYKEAWTNLGLAYELKEDYDNALKSIEEAVKIDDNYAFAWYNMGNIYKHRNELENAIESYKKATELEPEHAKSWLFLASIYHETKDYNIALEYLSKAIELDPAIAKKMSKPSKDFEKLITSISNKFTEIFKSK